MQKVKASHTHYRALGPELIPVYRQSAHIYILIQIHTYIHICRCMYVSGVPGTGKTATVHQVISFLREEYEAGDLPYFKFIEINGMRLTDPHQAYVQILEVTISLLLFHFQFTHYDGFNLLSLLFHPISTVVQVVLGEFS